MAADSRRKVLGGPWHFHLPWLKLKTFRFSESWNHHKHVCAEHLAFPVCQTIVKNGSPEPLRPQIWIFRIFYGIQQVDLRRQLLSPRCPSVQRSGHGVVHWFGRLRRYRCLCPLRFFANQACLVGPFLGSYRVIFASYLESVGKMDLWYTGVWVSLKQA